MFFVTPSSILRASILPISLTPLRPRPACGRKVTDLVELHRDQGLLLRRVSDQVAYDGKGLDDNGARDLGNVPDHAQALTPEVPDIVGVHAIAHHVGSPPGRHDGHKNTQAHGHAYANLFDLLYPQLPCYQPWEEGEGEVCDDIVHYHLLAWCSFDRSQKSQVTYYPFQS